MKEVGKEEFISFVNSITRGGGLYVAIEDNGNKSFTKDDKIVAKVENGKHLIMESKSDTAKIED